MPFGFIGISGIFHTLSSAKFLLDLESFTCVREALGNVAAGSYLDDQTRTFVDINGRMFAFLPRCLHILEMPY